MSNFRSILFDLGNVLVRFEPIRFFEILGVRDEERRMDVKASMLKLGRVYESGTIGTQEFRRQLQQIFNGEFSDDLLDEAFLGVLPEPISGVDRLVQEVATRYDIGLVSNTNPIHFHSCLMTMPVLKHVDRFHLSYKIGALKPEEMFYRSVIADERCEPGEMVFIDDVAENVEGANRAGFSGVLFTEVAELEQELSNLGVL